MKRLEVATPKEGLVDVTRLVEGALEGHTGLAFLYVPHTTCGLVVQEGADPDAVHDLLVRLEALALRLHPKDRHAEGNTHAQSQGPPHRGSPAPLRRGRPASVWPLAAGLPGGVRRAPPAGDRA